MNRFKISRRLLMQGSAAVGAGLGLGAAGGGELIGDASAQTAEKPAVLLIFLTGGYNALFSSTDSFLTGNRFGVTSTNMLRVGTSNLYIDKPTFGDTLGTAVTSKMAAVGLNHGISSHDPARVADFSNGTRSYPLMLAAAMGGTAAIKAAVVGSQMPFGPAPAESGVSLQNINDMRATINSLSGSTDPNVPNRGIAANGVTTAQTMGQPQFNANPTSLRMLKDAYAASITSLRGATQTFDYAALSAAYGIAATDTTVGTNFTKQMLAAELMITAGANVVVALNGGWDTHGDTSGSAVRAKMSGTILPGLRTFLNRMLPATGRNVTVAIYGDFARSLPGSDHARGVNATIIGKRVVPGNTGKMIVSSTGGGPTLAAGSPSTPGMFSLLATLSRVATNPFGTNPHGSLVGP